MVEAIAQIGRVMGIPIIAEGVENESLLNLVKEVGIEYAQGFTLHYPEPIQQAFRRRKA
jgi:EAL domain-containing protein (putative c-di-GMP-specific phosphodiesterase class I)